MANFEARAKELAERYKPMRPNMPPEDDARVTLALQNHARAREDYLNALTEALADKSDNLRADAIKTKLDAAATGVLDPLNRMLDGIRDPSSSLRAFQDIAKAEEARFFEQLKRAGVADNRDDQMLRCHKLELYVVDLKIKWMSMTDTEKELLERERYAAAQLRGTVKDAFEEATPTYAKGSRDLIETLAIIEIKKKELNDYVKQQAKKITEKYTGDPKLGEKLAEELGVGSKLAGYVYDGLSAAYNPLGAAVKTVGKAAKAVLPIAQALVDQKAGEIRQLLGGAQNVIVTFSTTRREATEYVRNNGYEQAKTQYDSGRRALEEWMNNLATDPLKFEAKRMFDAHNEVLQNFLELMRQAHGKFVDDYKGIFFEAVSEKTLNMLTDKPYYEEWYDGIKRLDMDQQLQKMYDGITDLNGNLDRAFGSMTLFNDLPLEAQAMLQEIVRKIENDLQKPFTDEMRENTKTLETANARKPATVLESVMKVGKEAAEKAIQG